MVWLWLQVNFACFVHLGEDIMASPERVNSNSGDRVNVDHPPFSRAFVVCSKNNTEEEIRACFAPYGFIEDIWMVKDRMTKENKGICYVKYDKASSAALAIENLDGKVLGADQKPIKVCSLVYGFSHKVLYVITLNTYSRVKF